MTDSTDFILGPQLATGDWFDTTLIAKARQHGEACPSSPPRLPIAPIEPDPADYIGRESEYQIALNRYNVLMDEYRQLSTIFWEQLDWYVLHNYYDLPASEYIAHRRTNDPVFLALGDKCADAWWQHPTWIGSGKIRKWPDEASPPPRHAGIVGLLVRAESRPEMYDWINDYSNYFYQNYVGKHLTRLPDGTYKTDALYDVREGAFSMRYLTLLAKVLPDSFPLQSGGMATNGAQLRAQYLAAVELGAVEYFGKNQRADGAYVWNDDWTDSDGGKLQGVCQPFIVGLLLRALCDVHGLTQNPAVKANVGNQILKGCRHLYSDGPYAKDLIEQKSGKRVRGFHYFYHGGTTVNPTKYEKGDMLAPWTDLEGWWLSSTRQAISTILGAFGKAYEISGDPFFRDAGNEMYDSAYLGTDGFRAMMDGTPKNYNQHVLGSSSYKAWLGGEVQPPPLPPPTIPVPDESPDGFKGARVVDSERAMWTIGPARQTLRNGTQAGGGEGSIYKYLTKTVYVLGTDANWYKWGGASWSFVGAQEPGVTIPVPEPPLPPPPPTPPQPPQPTTTRTVSWPKQASKQNPILNAQWAEKFRLKSVSDTSAVFEKVQ